MINQSKFKTDYSKANSIKLDELQSLILSIKNLLTALPNTDLTTLKNDIVNEINNALENISFDEVLIKLQNIDELLNTNLSPTISQTHQLLKNSNLSDIYTNILTLLIKAEEIIQAINNSGGGGNIDLSSIENKLYLLQKSIDDIASKLGSDSSGLDPELPYEPAPDVVYQTHHKKIIQPNYTFTKTSGSLEEEYYFQNDGVPSIMQIDYDILSNLDLELTIIIQINDNEVYRSQHNVNANTSTHHTHFATYISTRTENKVQLLFESNQAESINFSNIIYNLTADNAFFIHYTPKYNIASLQNNYYIAKYENHTLSHITTPSNNIDLTQPFTPIGELKDSFRYKFFPLLVYTGSVQAQYSGYSAAGKNLLRNIVGAFSGTSTFALFKGPTYTNVVDFDIATFICAQTFSFFTYIDGATNTLYTKQLNAARSTHTALGSYTPTDEGKLVCTYMLKNHITHSATNLIDCFVIATYANGDNYLYDKTLKISHKLGKGAKINLTMPYFVNTSNQYIRVFMYEVDHWICKVLRFTGSKFEVLDYFNIDGIYEEIHGGIYDDYFTYHDNQLIRNTFSGTEHSFDSLLG